MYVDGFVIPVPSKNLAAYRKMARQGARLWMEYGALDYHECVADDLSAPMGVSWAKQLGLKKGETVVFAWITYKSKAHRNAVNKKIMSDPSMASPPSGMPFDPKRMLFGGFKSIVDAPST